MLPLIFAILLAFIIIMYVILDGFDLGIGILFPFTSNEDDRDQMMNSIAPVWDGNETWLVFGGAMLYGAFPEAYGTLLPMVYMPLMLMLIALIFRGVSFEFRFKANTSKPLWNWLFSISSVAAAFLQGILLGCFVQGFPFDPTAFIATKQELWLTPFSLMTGIALVCGYGLLGATWMIMKSHDELQRTMIQYAKGLLVLVSFFLIIVSIWTPLNSQEVFDRWYRFPNMLLLSPLPLITAIVIYMNWHFLSKLNKEYQPFLCSILIFLCAYLGIAISVYPYLIPHQLTFWQAAAPNSTLQFILVGVVLMLPLLLAYTAYAYHVFRGKSYHNYH
jgi:cytochrome d ubiquinol oxidase subunit II